MRSETHRLDSPAGLLSATLLWPDKPGYTPAVVMDSDLAGCSQSTAHWMAEGLAQRGWAVLRFDHAGFGNSGGVRQQFDWSLQTASLTAAYWWLRKQTGIDGNRVGIWAWGLGVWRTLQLVHQGLPVKAAVVVNETIRQTRWIQPGVGIDVLLHAGFFDDDAPGDLPLLNARWPGAWGQLLRAPLPRLAAQTSTPIMRWVSKDQGPAAWAKHLKPETLEGHVWPTGSAGALALPPLDNPVLAETHAFFLQHL